MGTLGNDGAIQGRAAEWFTQYLTNPASVDANVLAAVIPILAHAEDDKRYEEFSKRFRSATTPQEEQRYLYALTGFRQAPLLQQTPARTLSGEIRSQDAPFVVRSLLTSVYGRELAWD